MTSGPGFEPNIIITYNFKIYKYISAHYTHSSRLSDVFITSYSFYHKKAKKFQNAHYETNRRISCVAKTFLEFVPR